MALFSTLLVYSNLLVYLGLQNIRSEKPPGISWKKQTVSKIGRTFDCLNKLFKWSQFFFCKFSAFRLEFQKFFSITRSFFFLQQARTILETKYHFYCYNSEWAISQILADLSTFLSVWRYEIVLAVLEQYCFQKVQTEELYMYLSQKSEIINE